MSMRCSCIVATSPSLPGPDHRDGSQADDGPRPLRPVQPQSPRPAEPQVDSTATSTSCLAVQRYLLQLLSHTIQHMLLHQAQLPTLFPGLNMHCCVDDGMS